MKLTLTDALEGALGACTQSERLLRNLAYSSHLTVDTVAAAFERLTAEMGFGKRVRVVVLIAHASETVKLWGSEYDKGWFLAQNKNPAPHIPIKMVKQFLEVGGPGMV